VIRLEGWMKLQELRQQGLSISEISRTLHLDRKTVRKQLTEPLHSYQRRRERERKREAYAAYLRERWEQGVHNASKLFAEIQKRGYAGGYTRIKELLRPWREEERQRAYVRFETGPGEQSQMDWGHFGNWQGQRLYAFALTLSYSRMRYVEFTQRQDTETLLSCLVHAFHYLGGVTESILTDNMKTVVEDRVEGRIVWNRRFLDFAAYYGFVPRVCQPYRPQTKGKVESTIGFLKKNFWPGVEFTSLDDLNTQAWLWTEEVNARPHGTTGEKPLARWGKEALRSVAGQPDYDTGYACWRQVAKDCLFSYRGQRYSVPHAYAGKTVLVKEPVRGTEITVWQQNHLLCRHRLGTRRGEFHINPDHYRGLPGSRSLRPALAPLLPVGAPEVEIRPLAVYEEVSHGATI
jgi:transposase